MFNYQAYTPELPEGLWAAMFSRLQIQARQEPLELVHLTDRPNLHAHAMISRVNKSLNRIAQPFVVHTLDQR